MMTSSNGKIFRVTGHLCGEFTGHRWIPRTKASDAELMFCLICVWINGWVNNREAGDLRRYRAHYDVTVMIPETHVVESRTFCMTARAGYKNWNKTKDIDIYSCTNSSWNVRVAMCPEGRCHRWHCRVSTARPWRMGADRLPWCRRETIFSPPRYLQPGVKISFTPSTIFSPLTLSDGISCCSQMLWNHIMCLYNQESFLYYLWLLFIPDCVDTIPKPIHPKYRYTNFQQQRG